MSKDTIAKLGIYIFILVVGYLGTIIEFKKANKKKKFNKDSINEAILKTLEEEKQ